ncbi:hypothetical protein [Actinacidiphila guanduensis]|jgi:hypothetical protein|uniref:Uncharacterized protein n=1 Tax=Actinacidiphila guanduensis TaxID=310781 RepID=A0A1G9VB69_9ACTN|nr:hypothetical protein [Actinacidiphila guanduensis]SDM69316.1 hypothetical protein SAMN05216259_101203 [Actinacidiphila guanduensis]
MGDAGVACVRCRDLRARFRDPATPSPGALLYAWATHHLDDHKTVPSPRPDCTECDRFATGEASVRADVWQRWAQVHYMKCQLAPDWRPPSP